MIGPDTTMTEAIDEREEMNAASFKLTEVNEDDEEECAIVLLNGIPETREALELIENLEEEWNGMVPDEPCYTKWKDMTNAVNTTFDLDDDA